MLTPKTTGWVRSHDPKPVFSRCHNDFGAFLLVSAYYFQCHFAWFDQRTCCLQFTTPWYGGEAHAVLSDQQWTTQKMRADGGIIIQFKACRATFTSQVGTVHIYEIFCFVGHRKRLVWIYWYEMSDRRCYGSMPIRFSNISPSGIQNVHWSEAESSLRRDLVSEVRGDAPNLDEKGGDSTISAHPKKVIDVEFDQNMLFDLVFSCFFIIWDVCIHWTWLPSCTSASEEHGYGPLKIGWAPPKKHGQQKYIQILCFFLTVVQFLSATQYLLPSLLFPSAPGLEGSTFQSLGGQKLP